MNRKFCVAPTSKEQAHEGEEAEHRPHCHACACTGQRACLLIGMCPMCTHAQRLVGTQRWGPHQHRLFRIRRIRHHLKSVELSASTRSGRSPATAEGARRQRIAGIDSTAGLPWTARQCRLRNSRQVNCFRWHCMVECTTRTRVSPRESQACTGLPRRAAHGALLPARRAVETMRLQAESGRVSTRRSSECSANSDSRWTSASLRRLCHWAIGCANG